MTETIRDRLKRHSTRATLMLVPFVVSAVAPGLGATVPYCELWRTASFAGHSEAQWHLGNAYESGLGVRKDLTKAYAWYRCSIESASAKVRSKAEGFEVEADILKEAKESVQELRESLSASELARGDALANEYVGRYGKPAP